MKYWMITTESKWSNSTGPKHTFVTRLHPLEWLKQYGGRTDTQDPQIILFAMQVSDQDAIRFDPDVEKEEE